MKHAHHGDPPDYTRAFELGIGLNALFVAVEAGCGMAFDSMALVSDAGHNLSDVIALALAWSAFWLAGAQPTERRTYGLKRATILAAVSSAVFLCVALGAVIWEAVSRFANPAPTSGLAVMVVAGVGVLVNGFTAALFMIGRKTDLNIKGAYLHMVADAVVSLGVVVTGAVIYATGWLWVDPLVALAVGIAILLSGIGLFRESVDLAMDAVPRHVDPSEVRSYLAALPGVLDVHDLHIWGMSTTETALTAHLVIRDGRVDDGYLQSVCETLRSRFSIQHPTIQIEDGTAPQRCVYVNPGCVPSA